MTAKTTTTKTVKSIDVRLGEVLDKINTNKTAMFTAIQDGIVMLVEHALGDGKGDVTRFAKLLDSVGSLVRRKVIMDYILEYTPIVIEPKAGSFYCHIAKQGKNFKPYNLEGLSATNWWEAKGAAHDPELKTFKTVLEDLQKIADRYSQWVRKGKIEDETDKADTLALVTYLRSFKAPEHLSGANDADTTDAEPLRNGTTG